MADTLLWDIVLDWLHTKYYNFKVIAVIDSSPIYQIEKGVTLSYMLIEEDSVQVSPNRINLSNYNGTGPLTIMGPNKTLHPWSPTFFDELEMYLNRESEAQTNVNSPHITVTDCHFDGTNKKGPAIKIVVPEATAEIAHNTFQNYESIIQLPPPVDPDPPV